MSDNDDTTVHRVTAARSRIELATAATATAQAEAGRLLQTVRHARGLTRADVAAVAHIGSSTVGKAEAGMYIGRRSLDRLCVALRLPPGMHADVLASFGHLPP